MLWGEIVGGKRFSEEKKGKERNGKAGGEIGWKSVYVCMYVFVWNIWSNEEICNRKEFEKRTNNKTALQKCVFTFCLLYNNT